MCKTCLWKSSPLTKSFHCCCTAPDICAGLCFWTLRPKAVRFKMTDQHMCVVVFTSSVLCICAKVIPHHSCLVFQVLSPAHSLFFQNCIAKGSTFRSVSACCFHHRRVFHAVSEWYCRRLYASLWVAVFSLLFSTSHASFLLTLLPYLSLCRSLCTKPHLGNTLSVFVVNVPKKSKFSCKC